MAFHKSVISFPPPPEFCKEQTIRNVANLCLYGWRSAAAWEEWGKKAVLHLWMVARLQSEDKVAGINTQRWGYEKNWWATKGMLWKVQRRAKHIKMASVKHLCSGWSLVLGKSVNKALARVWAQSSSLPVQDTRGLIQCFKQTSVLCVASQWGW